MMKAIEVLKITR